MKILLTGFEAFNGNTVNPAWELVNAVQTLSPEMDLIKLKLPTAYDKASELLCEKILECKPNYVLSIGQAGGVSSLSFEYLGINLQAANISDNLGQKRDYQAIDPLGPAAYFVTVPVREIVQELKKELIPATISFSAGTFVCNEVLYSVLHYIAQHKLPVKAGFLHVPYLPEQVINKPKTSSMPLELMLRGLNIALALLN